MKRLFGAAAVCILAISTQAQDIKPLDYAGKYKQQQIRERHTYEVKYQGNKAVDSVLLGTAFLDENGRMTKYIEYFMKGRKMAEYDYQYDESGKIIANTVKLAFNQWQTLQFELKYDAKGKLIERSLPEPVANFWQKETYSYTSAGVLIKSEQWYSQNGNLLALSNKEYPTSIQPSETSLTYIHDQNGLMMVHQFYSLNGSADKAHVFKYIRY